MKIYVHHRNQTHSGNWSWPHRHRLRETRQNLHGKKEWKVFFCVKTTTTTNHWRRAPRRRRWRHRPSKFIRWNVIYVIENGRHSYFAKIECSLVGDRHCDGRHIVLVPEGIHYLLPSGMARPVFTLSGLRSRPHRNALHRNPVNSAHTQPAENPQNFAECVFAMENSLLSECVISWMRILVSVWIFDPVDVKPIKLTLAICECRSALVFLHFDIQPPPKAERLATKSFLLQLLLDRSSSIFSCWRSLRCFASCRKTQKGKDDNNKVAKISS